MHTQKNIHSAVRLQNDIFRRLVKWQLMVVTTCYCVDVDLQQFKLKVLDRKIQVAAVSYLNTKPLVYGFEKGMLKEEMDLYFDYPAKVAEMLTGDKADIGLIPVAAIPKLTEHHIISDYGIATDGEVASVCLFSDVPLKQIEVIYLDYQSRTSVALLQVLLKDHWKIKPRLMAASPGFETQINGNTAGLVIGDRALIQRKISKYIFDLGTGWKEMTGLPFVFAAWVANKQLGEDFEDAFNRANGFGIAHIDQVVTENPYEAYDLKKYYTQNISYRFDDLKREGLALFLKKLERY